MRSCGEYGRDETERPESREVRGRDGKWTKFGTARSHLCYSLGVNKAIDCGEPAGLTAVNFIYLILGVRCAGYGGGCASKRRLKFWACRTTGIPILSNLQTEPTLLPIVCRVYYSTTPAHTTQGVTNRAAFRARALPYEDRRCACLWVWVGARPRAPAGCVCGCSAVLTSDAACAVFGSAYTQADSHL